MEGGGLQGSEWERALRTGINAFIYDAPETHLNPSPIRRHRQEVPSIPDLMSFFVVNLVCMCVHTHVHMQSLEDNMKSVPFSYHVGFTTQAIRLGGNHL